MNKDKDNKVVILTYAHKELERVFKTSSVKFRLLNDQIKRHQSNSKNIIYLNDRNRVPDINPNYKEIA
jgi:hypothetical protein